MDLCHKQLLSTGSTDTLGRRMAEFPLECLQDMSVHRLLEEILTIVSFICTDCLLPRKVRSVHILSISRTCIKCIVAFIDRLDGL